MEFINHSIIPSYPPDITKYPKFYDHKNEYVIILNPGEGLYIPPNWFHWVFSYPDIDKSNVAISYQIKNNERIIKEEPFKFNVNRDEYYNLGELKDNYEKEKFRVLKSKKNIIIPVKKYTLKNKVYKDNLTFKEIKDQLNDYNVYIGQNNRIRFIPPPGIIIEKLGYFKFMCFYWLAFFKIDTEYIESGLHYDKNHGVLISLSGIKVVRLYHPDNAKNFYLEKMNEI